MFYGYFRIGKIIRCTQSSSFFIHIFDGLCWQACYSLFIEHTKDMFQNPRFQKLIMQPGIGQRL